MNSQQGGRATAIAARRGWKYVVRSAAGARGRTILEPQGLFTILVQRKAGWPCPPKPPLRSDLVFCAGEFLIFFAGLPMVSPLRTIER